MHHVELISSESGLNDIVVNDVVGDEHGVIWVGTENGLSRYINGKFEHYHEYSERIQLVGHTVTKLFIDSKGRLWVGDRLQGVTVIDLRSNLSYCFSNSEPNRKLYGKEVYDFVEDSKGNVWAQIFPDILSRFSSDLNEIHSFELSASDEGEPNRIESICMADDKIFVVSTESGVCYFDEDIGKLRPVKWINPKVELHEYGNYLTSINSTTLFYKSNTKAYKIDLKNKQVTEILSDLVHMKKVSVCQQNQQSTYLIQYPNIWKLDSNLQVVSAMNIVMPPELDHLYFVQKKCYLNKSNILFIGTDQGIIKLNVEQQYFKIAQKMQSGQGLSLSASYLRKIYKLKNGNILCSYVDEAHIDLLDINKKGNHNTISKVTPIPLSKKLENPQRLNGIIETKKGEIYLSSYNFFFQLNKAQTKADEVQVKPRSYLGIVQSVWAMEELSEDKILLGTKQRGIHFFDPTKKVFSPAQVFIRGKGEWSQQNSIWEFYRDSKDSIWIISSQGLFRLLEINNDSIYLKHFDVLKDYSIWAIAESEEGEMWLGSVEHGIHCIDKSGKLLAHLGFGSGLKSMTICSILKDEEGRIWATSPLGLYLVDSKSKKILRYFSSMEELHLQGFNLRSSLIDDSGRLYFGTKMGLLYFDPREVLKKPDKSSSLLVLNRINGHTQTFDFHIEPTLELDNGIRSIDIEPALIDYLDPEKNTYWYRLVGAENEWNTLSGPLPRIVYLNLQPGKYELEIKAFDANGIEAANTLCLPIKVIPYFWETNWFMVALILLIVFIIIYFLRLRWLSSRSEAQLMESQMTSLRAQMNPHFFFNALNSIQDYIFHKDSEKAANYMSGFAKLLRNILDNSSERYISLRDEIKFLNQYLELEALRFEDQMKYSVEVEEGLDIDKTLIPNMLIQPIVENSVKHGLAPLHSGMQLQIKFYRREGHLICEIDDNGVGRNQGVKSKHSHNSKGIRTVEERMSLLSNRKKQKLKLEIEDKKDSKGNALGTKVVLLLS